MSLRNLMELIHHKALYAIQKPDISKYCGKIVALNASREMEYFCGKTYGVQTFCNGISSLDQ